MTNLLRKIFFLNRIYRRTTPRRIVTIYGCLLLILLVARQVLIEAQPYAYQAQAFAVILPVYLYMLLRTLIRTVLVNKRIALTVATDPANEMLDPAVVDSVTYSEYVTKRREVQAQLRNGQGWKVYDLVFYFRSNGQEDYATKELYYTVFDGELVRQTPHIVFDSKTAHRQQFKNIYSHAQRLSLEGNFDHYFDTYVPQTYKIDSLGFITPEVMQQLITAKDYDIELVDGRLLLLGPLTDIADLDAMQSLGERLTAAFNDNLATYKDDRLVGAGRASEVTPFARGLIRSVTRPIIGVLAVVALIGLCIFQSIVENNAITPLIIAGILTVILIVAVKFIVQTMQNNQKMLNDAMLDNERQKPRF